MSDSSRVKILIALLIVYFVWGSTYLAMRVGVRTVPPFILASCRFTIAGTMLLVVAVWRSEPRPHNWFEVRHAVETGVLLLGMANGLLVWALQWVESGLAALFIATVMLWTSFFEALRPGGEQLTALKVLAGFFGLAGVALLLLPEARFVHAPRQLMGEVGLLLAAIIWSAGSIYSRHVRMPRSTLYSAGLQMLAAAVFQFLLALVSGQCADLSHETWTWPGIAAILYLAILGSGVAFSAYTWLMQVASPALTATYAFVNPAVAVLLGVVFLDESLTPNMVVGGSLIVTAVILVWAGYARSRI